MVTDTKTPKLDTATRVERTADLVQVDKALESMRDAGFDLTAAAGEPVDNSIEAGATIVRIETEFDPSKKRIDRIIFADNGSGIAPSVLAHALSVGYSTRYNSRKGLGRFGVGMKFAALSVGTRIDIYTRQAGSDEHFHAFVDLDLIRNNKQKKIAAVSTTGFPEPYDRHMTGPNGTAFESGTLVIWSGIDRLENGGRYGTALQEKVADLRTFLARAYRKFLDKGVSIELNGKAVLLHDPLFLMDNPRVAEKYPKSTPKGTVVDADRITIDGHEVKVTIALVPELFRWREGDGGQIDKDKKDISDFHINKENAGRLSILRNGREIYYDIVPRLYGGVDKVDRYIGIEVSFPADLDEYFQVRNVKRGAEPVAKLREELRKFLEKPVRMARKNIREKWGAVEREDRKTFGDHAPAMTTVEKVDETSPRGLAGAKLTSAEQEAKIDELLKLVTSDPEAVERFKATIAKLPFVLIDGSWRGKDLLDLAHLNGKAVVTVNSAHPFFKSVYGPLATMASTPAAEIDSENAIEVARKVQKALDMLILAYAKAENMHRDPDTAYGALRERWGQFLHSYLAEAGYA